jgi:hypothetical protein
MADLLRTDYKDDILDAEKNTSRKYNMITNEDGTVSFEDKTDYTQTGDNFGSGDINRMNNAINDLSKGNGGVTISKKDVYSTEEQEIGTWIDGKPIYRKVMSIGTLPKTVTTYQLGFSISECIKADLIGTQESIYKRVGNLPSLYVDYFKNNNEILINNEINALENVYLILEYTKQ